MLEAREEFFKMLLTIAANPRSILTNAAVDLIKSVPAVWDETIVLPDSEIGGLAAYARRTGGTWFLAVMCGPQPKETKVPLSFLGDGQYKASFVRDAENDDSLTVENATSKRSDSLSIKLRAGGGFVGRFNQDQADHKWWCESIQPFRNIAAQHAFLHPPYGEQIVKRREQPVPDAVMRLPRFAWIVPDRDFRHGEAFDLDQGRQKPVHAFEEFQISNALALEGAVATARVADGLAGNLVAHPVGDARGGDAEEVVALAAGGDA